MFHFLQATVQILLYEKLNKTDKELPTYKSVITHVQITEEIITNKRDKN